MPVFSMPIGRDSKGVKLPAKVVEVLSPPICQITVPAAFWLPEMTALEGPERLPMGMVMPSAGGVAVYSMRTCSRFTVASGRPVLPPNWMRGSVAPLTGLLTLIVPAKADQSPVIALR